MTRRQLASDAWENVKFRLRGSTDEATDALRERIFRSTRGRARARPAAARARVLAGVLPRVYPQMLEIAYEHQDAGRPIFIVTAASQEMAELMAHVLAFDGGIGARLGGRRRPLHRPRRRPVHVPRGQGGGDPRRSPSARASTSPCRTRTRDSESDLPMLRLVGHPVAVNPDTALARVAREEGWEVLRFERLGRRLRVLGAAGVAAALGGLGSAVLSRRSAPPRRRAAAVIPLRRR